MPPGYPTLTNLTGAPVRVFCIAGVADPHIAGEDVIPPSGHVFEWLPARDQHTTVTHTMDVPGGDVKQIVIPAVSTGAGTMRVRRMTRSELEAHDLPVYAKDPKCAEDGVLSEEETSAFLRNKNVIVASRELANHLVRYREERKRAFSNYKLCIYTHCVDIFVDAPPPAAGTLRFYE